MDPTLKKTCEWIQNNQNILDRTSYIISHDPVSALEIHNYIFVHGKQTLVFDHLLADSNFKKTYLTFDPKTNEPMVLGITKSVIPIHHGELNVLLKLQELNLPGIVPIKKITYLPTGEKAIVYGFCNGGNLEDRIMAKTLSDKAKILITRSILRTVALLHENGIIHRDLKAPNFLLSVNPENVITDVYLSDFGESIFIEAPRSLSNIEHSHSPPEANEAMERFREQLELWHRLESLLRDGPVDPEWKAQVEKEVDPLTQELNIFTKVALYDSWGLGLTLYCLWNESIYREFPWSASVLNTAYGDIAHKKWTFVKSIQNKPFPETIKEILQGLLHADIEKRLSASEAATLALELR